MKITLNNGREFEVYGCGVSGGTLCIDLPASVGFVEAVTAFDDPAATSVIAYESAAERLTYEGYTHICRAGYSVWKDNALTIVLKKE